MSIVVYAMDVSTLDPGLKSWSRWVDAPRLAAAAQLRRREDQALAVGAGLLLLYAVRQVRPGQPLPLDVKTASGGKPFLPALPDFHFSISHSGVWAVFAASGHPVGVDIEQVANNMHEVARRMFSPAEQEVLLALPGAERSAAACESWVLKESYMKATGLGFQLPMERLSLRLGPPPILLQDSRPVGGTVALCPFPDAAYRLALADSQSDSSMGKVRIIGWEALLGHLTESAVGPE